jgi:hypothetical protein
MRRIVFFLLIIQSFCLQISQGQKNNPCSDNEKEYEKMRIKTLTDPRLLKIVESFFVLEDTTKPDVSLIEYKAIIVNDSLVKIIIDDEVGLKYEIKAESRKFIASKHRITENGNGNICQIDNKVIWGTDGGIPMEELSLFEVKINNQIISLPLSDYKDLFNPFLKWGKDLVHLNAWKDKKGGYVLIILNGSDGAGGYSAIWIFKNGKYLRRVVESLC